MTSRQERTGKEKLYHKTQISPILYRLKIFSPNILTIILVFVKASILIWGLKNSHFNIYCSIETHIASVRLGGRREGSEL